MKSHIRINRIKIDIIGLRKKIKDLREKRDSLLLERDIDNLEIDIMAVQKKVKTNIAWIRAIENPRDVAGNEIIEDEVHANAI